MLSEVHGDDGARFQVLFGGINSLKHQSSDGVWKNFLCSHLQYARASRVAGREEHPKIEIVREDY